MRSNDMVGFFVSVVLGRVIRRAICGAAALLLSTVALGFLTAAGLLVLDLNLGLLYAEIIVGSIYAVTAAGLFVGLIATRSRSSTASLASAAGSGIARNAQVAMIVEALMLGYMLANKSGSRRQ